MELREAMKALRPKMGDKAAQQQLLNAVKDPAVREQILAMISKGEGAATGDGGQAPQNPPA
jgi:predicted component of type VI protein secretion system